MQWPSWTSGSFECDLLQTMASETSATLLMVLMLAALDISAGAPVDFPTEEPSGAGDEGGSNLLGDNQLWDSLLGATQRHEQEFKEEFPDRSQYELDQYNIASLPENCHNSSINMEGCLRRLVQGLLVYQVLLRHVEQEYPLSQVLPNAKTLSSPLINAAKEKMRKPDAIKALSSSQEATLLMAVNHSNTFERKMYAHNILQNLYEFLKDIRGYIQRREKRQRYLSL